MSKISVNGLNKSYYIDKDEYKVLKELDLSLESGEFVAIYGESGSGKSTLMNVLGGLDIFQSGEILIEGENINNFTNKSMDYYRNRKIGFIFQEFNLLENLKVIDNVIIPMTIAGVSDKEAKKRAKELLVRVGLESQMKKRVNQLSGGQKQRVAIARALANDPDIILADEPTGALDSKTTAEILELLQSISKDGKLIVAITHSEAVANYATRVVNLLDGKIVDDSGTSFESEEVKDEINFKRDYSKLSLRKAFKIAKSNLFSKKVRTLLVSIGVSIGITGSIVITSISEDMINQVNQDVSGLISDEKIVNVAVVSDSADVFDENTAKEEMKALETYFEDNKSVLSIEPERFLGYYDMYEYEDDNGVLEKSEEFVSVIDADYSSPDTYTMKFGEYPSSSNEVFFTGDGVAVLDFALENNIETDLSYDDIFTMTYSNDDIRYEELLTIVEENIIGDSITVDGLDGKKEVFEVVGSLDISLFSSGGFRAPYNQNKELFNHYENMGYGYMYYVIFEDVESAEKFIDETGDLENTISGIDTGYEDFKLYNLDNRALLSIINTIVTLVRNVFLVLIAVSLVVSVFMVNVIVYISTIERKIEIGTLRAIGAKRKDIRHIFISEGIIIGIIAFIQAVIGSFVLITIANLANYILSEQTGDFFVFTLSIPYLILIALIVFAVMFLASLLPAIKASHQNPIDALREE